MKLSVVIPVHNEQDCIAGVVGALTNALAAEAIPYEIILVNDNSSDNSPSLLEDMAGGNPGIKIVHRTPPKGFGYAVRAGLSQATGDAVVICMGDQSDDPGDVVAYYRKLQEGYDCVFGSRFVKGSRVNGYPGIKLILNRLGNAFIQLLFLLPYNDVSNAFKAYRIGVIKSIQPLVSQYFNITVEIPLKAVVRGYSYAVVPINWYGRKSGVSKYNVRELSRKYFFSILYVWLEKILLKEDIQKTCGKGIFPVCDE